MIERLRARRARAGWALAAVLVASALATTLSPAAASETSAGTCDQVRYAIA